MGPDGKLVVQWLAISVVFFELVDDQKGEVMLLWVFDGDNTVFIFAIADLKRKQLQMVRVESELHLSHPYPT